MSRRSQRVRSVGRSFFEFSRQVAFHLGVVMLAELIARAIWVAHP